MFSVWQRWTISKGKINRVHKTPQRFTWGHSPPEWALRLISSTVFFLESWSERDTNTGLMYLIKAERKQRNTAWLNAGAKALFRRLGKNWATCAELDGIRANNCWPGGVFMIYTNVQTGQEGRRFAPVCVPCLYCLCISAGIPDFYQWRLYLAATLGRLTGSGKSDWSSLMWQTEVSVNQRVVVSKVVLPY